MRSVVSIASPCWVSIGTFTVSSGSSAGPSTVVKHGADGENSNENKRNDYSASVFHECFLLT